ncbi:MAG: Ig-like domain-containing protein [Candidatus Marinimicrobia bacterium]|nr:Ig-like domain-containing protein [Candidatus Neomarinimicrobiota bacterium]
MKSKISTFMGNNSEYRRDPVNSKLRMLFMLAIVPFLSQATLFGADTFTVTGGTVVSSYWNSTNTGATANFTATANPVDYAKIKISVNGGAFAEITGGGINVSTGQSKSINLTASNIESAGTLSDGETFEIYAVFTYTGAPVDTIKLTSSAITVDQTLPTSFTVGTVTTVGGNIVGNKWNSSNTSISVNVPIGNDNSLLTPGKVQLLGKIGSNPYEDLGAESAITGINTTKTMTINAATLEALLGFSDGQIIYLKAEITDKAGNLTTGNASGSELTIDQTAPTISSISGTPASGTLGIGGTSSITVTFDEVVRLSSGNLEITLETGSIDRVLNIASTSIDNVNSASQTYQVQAGDESSDLDVRSLALSGGNNLRDLAGNDVNLALPVGSNLADNANLVVDGIVPTITSITSSPVTDDLGVSESIDITVNFSEAVTLASGNLLIELETGATDRTLTISSINSANSASASYTVQASDESSDLTVNSVTLSAGNLQDGAGNDADMSIPGGDNLADNSTIVVDGVAPNTVNLAGGAGTVVATGGTVAAGYWNNTNTGLSVTVPIAADASLNGGSIQLKGYWGVVGGAQNLGSAQTINATGTNKTISIAETTIENFGGYTDGAILKIVAIVTDASGNTSSVGTESDDEITVDITAPSMTSISATPASGNLGVGDVANIEITFDEAVTLAGGNLLIELETGTTDRTVTIATVSASTTADGDYTVQAGDDTPLAGLNVNSVTLSAGSLRDAAGNNFSSTLPTGSNLADNTNLDVDGIVPTITSITSNPVSSNLSIGEEVEIIVTFSEDVTLSGGNMQIELETGAVDRTVTVATISSTNTASGTYTVQSNDVSSDLTVNSVSLSAGSLQDAAGNDTDLSIPGGNNLANNSSIVVDGLVPSTVNLAGGAGTVAATGGTVVAGYWNSTNTALSITVPIAADASLNGGSVQIQGYWGVVGGAQNLGTAQTISATGTNKTISIAAATLESFGGFAEGEVLKIVALVTDLAGNTSMVGTESDNEITIDQTAPTISNVSSTTADGYLIPTDVANVTLTFDEAVTLSGGNLLILLETGSTDRTVTITTVSASTTASGDYTVQTGDVSDDLDVISVSLSAGFLRDDAGNNAIRTLPTGSNLADNSNLVVDGVIPTITSITSSSADTDPYPIGGTINITVNFSEAVTLSGGNLQIELETGNPDQTVSISSINSSTTATGTYTVQAGDVSSDLAVNGPLTLSGGSLQDAAGNDVNLTVTTNLSASSDIVIDGVAPSAVNLAGGAGTVIAIGGVVKAGYWNSTNTALSITVPIAADATLNGGSLQLKAYWGSDVGAATNLGTSQTISATGTNKTVSIQKAILEAFGGYVEGGVLKIVALVTDAAGNTSPVGTESDNEITIDQTAPTISNVSSTTADGYLIKDDVANVTVTFDEAVTLSGGNLLVILETGTTDRTVTITLVNASTTATGDYTVQTNDLSSDLDVNSIELSTGSLRDAAGNSADLTLPTGSNLADNSNLVVDGVIPTITSITSTSDDTNPYPVGGTVNITVNFSEPVTLSGGNLRITLETGTTDRTISISAISSALSAIGTYTIQAGDETSDLSVNGPLTLSAGSLRDAAGNNVDLTVGTNLSAASDFVIDGVVPDPFIVGSVVTVGAPVLVGYWNASNTGMTVTIPIANDASLVGGTVQVQGYYGDISGSSDIASPTNITIGMLGTSYPVSITSANIATNVGFNENQTLKITAEISDDAGNSTRGTQSANVFFVDETLPVITSITSVPTSGTYKETETIDITVTFSENVYLVNGDLQTTLETGDVLTTVAADLNGVNALTETYTVGVDDESNDLSVTTLGLTAGTLRDAAGNNATLGIPPNGTNLSDNSNLIIDGSIPTILSITTPDEDGYYGVGDVVNIAVKFSENVSLSGGNNFQVVLDAGQTISSGTISNVDSVVIQYTVQETDESNGLYATAVNLDGGTLQDAAGNNLNLAITSLENIDDASSIYIDGIYPTAFATGDIFTVGEPVVTGFWNRSNDSLKVIIPVTGNDASLDGGSAYIEARMDANTFASAGDAVAVGTNPVTLALSRAQLQTVAGYFAGSVIEVRGVLIDIAGNETIGTTSAISLTSDQINPTATITGNMVVAGGSVSQGYWNPSNETLTVSTALDADNSLIGGTFQLQRRIGIAGTFTNISTDSTISVVGTNMETVIDADEINAFGFAEGDVIDFRAIVTDQAGNSTTGTAGDNWITIDSGDPQDFTVGEINSIGGTVVDDYYNSTNLGATVTVPIDPTDNTLVGGYVQLRSIINSDPAADFLDSLNINSLTDLIFSITRADLDGLGYAEADTITFDAIITDVAGNSTVGTQSVEYLVVDETLPTVSATDNIKVQGTNIEPGYWNSTSTGITFKVAVDILDVSLVGGKISASADLTPSANTVFETFATTMPINSLGVDSISLLIPASEIEALEGGTGFTDGLVMSFKVAITDVAGNKATSVTSAVTFDIDQTAPLMGSFVTARTTTDPFINNEDSLLAKWQGFSDVASGLDHYEYSIGSDEFLADIAEWEVVDTLARDTIFTYTHLVSYFINVRAIDLAGNISNTIVTDAIVADLVLPTSTADINPYYYTDDWNNVNSFSGTAQDGLSGPDSLVLKLERVSDSFWWGGSAWGADADSFKYKITDGTWSFGIVKDSLDNREDYTVYLTALDSAGNWQTTPSEYEFQFVINTAPEFAEITDTLYVDEDELFDYHIIATDVDLGTISGDTLFYSILDGPDGMTVDSLTAIFDWTPENADVDTFTITAKVRDLFDESDTMSFVLVVIQVNDAPEPVTLLLPADSTQLVPADSLLLTFVWSSAFDIEGDSLNYRIYMQGTNYDTSLYAAADTTVTVDVSVMDFPTVNPVRWFVRALDATEISATADTFHVTTSPPAVVLLADTVDNQMLRYTMKDTLFTIANIGLTDLKWSLHSAPRWISMTKESGVVEFMDTTDVAFHIDLGGITVGTYSDSITILTNDPDHDTVTVYIGLRILDTPTPVLAFYKNPAYPGYYELMIVDSLGMVDTLKVKLGTDYLTVTEVDTFSFLVSMEIETAGSKSFEVYASNWAGDTTITTTVAVSLARKGEQWIARSADDQFEARGSAKSAARTSQIAILDSVLSEVDDGRYKILMDGMSMAEPILVSMPSEKTDQAIYMNTDNGEYVELPSVHDGKRVSAWVERSGVFKFGPKTIIVPERSSLTQNYPNPFNPSTNIDYDIGFLDGMTQNIEFNVYNIRGQLVKRLVDKQLPPGQYSVSWNGLDQYGKQVSSGIYFARLMTDRGYVKTVKMLVLR